MRRDGFTLLEVMVAVAILALALVSIYASQAGAVAAGTRAKMLTIATSLARCRMGEVEERLARDGYPATAEDEEGACCEDVETDGFRCRTRIDAPSFAGLAGSGEEEDADASGAGSAGAGAKPPGGDAASAAVAAAGAASDQGVQSVDEVAGLAIAFLPMLEPIFQGFVRRVTVEITWREPGRAKDPSFTVSQYVSDPARAPALPIPLPPAFIDLAAQFCASAGNGSSLADLGFGL